MHAALILHGCIVMVFGALVFALRAKQVRRELDETMIRKASVERHLSIAETVVVPTKGTEAGAGSHTDKWEAI